MAGKIVRTGVAVVGLTGATIAAGVTPAQAHPMALHERIFTYFHSAQHRDTVGQRFVGGCIKPSNWGITTAYDTSSFFSC
jgi:hypothetical protein